MTDGLWPRPDSARGPAAPQSRGRGRLALVGSTGFVGGNLQQQMTFSATFSSRNSDQMTGQSFDTVIFSAARAEKWRANRRPEADKQHVDELIRLVSSFRARRLVLISTVDVYANPRGVDEATRPTRAGLHAYGSHRLELEEVVRERFDDHLVVRLPGLYGPGLKKNALFDLAHDHDVHLLDGRASYQFYDLRRLAADIDIAAAHRLPLVHLAPQPVALAEVARRVFGRELGDTTAAPASYDLRTRHAELFGGAVPYLETTAQVLAGISRWVAARGEERRAGPVEHRLG